MNTRTLPIAVPRRLTTRGVSMHPVVAAGVALEVLPLAKTTKPRRFRLYVYRRDAALLCHYFWRERADGWEFRTLNPLTGRDVVPQADVLGEVANVGIGWRGRGLALAASAYVALRESPVLSESLLLVPKWLANAPYRLAFAALRRHPAFRGMRLWIRNSVASGETILGYSDLDVMIELPEDVPANVRREAEATAERWALRSRKLDFFWLHPGDLPRLAGLAQPMAATVDAELHRRLGLAAVRPNLPQAFVYLQRRLLASVIKADLARAFSMRRRSWLRVLRCAGLPATAAEISSFAGLIAFLERTLWTPLLGPTVARTIVAGLEAPTTVPAFALAERWLGFYPRALRDLLRPERAGEVEAEALALSRLEGVEAEILREYVQLALFNALQAVPRVGLRSSRESWLFLAGLAELRLARAPNDADWTKIRATIQVLQDRHDGSFKS